MKKLALLLLSMLLLTACGKPSAKSTADLSVRELVDSVMNTAQMVSMPKSDLEDVLGIDPADWKEAVYLQDEGMGGNEALVIRAVDKEAAVRVAERLGAYLEQRRKETRNYLPQTYKLLEAAKVETKNLTVALISAPKAAELQSQLLSGE